MDSPTDTALLHGRALAPLLTAITVLLTILVVGLGIGAIMAVRAVHEAREQVAQLTGGARGDARQKAKALGADIVERQEVLARALASESAAAERKIETFQGRLKQLYPIAQGFTRKLDQTIGLQLLMNDQMILMNHQLAALQQTAARGLRPVDAERALTPGSGTGGSGPGASHPEDERPRGQHREPTQR